MGKNRVKQAVPPRPVWRGAVLGTLVLIAVSGGTFWWLSKPQEAAAGPPHLVVDRTDVDLGYQPFDTTARVVFVLTNAGTGPLELVDVPRVKALEGC